MPFFDESDRQTFRAEGLPFPVGADVLPAKVAPCTAVVTTVRRGEPGAVLHYADPARATR